jgi:hypothetical protein
VNPTNKVTRSLVSLKLPKPVAQLIPYAAGIVTGMTNNPAFPNPVVPLATVNAAISALHTAEAAALTRAKGAVATRNEKRAALVSLLEQLRAYVQARADATPENGASIIESAGMAVRKVATHPARTFTAKAGAVSGSVTLYAKSVGDRAAYMWEYSTDGGKTWLALPPTLQAKTTVTGLTPGSSVEFRYRAVTKTGAADWSLPITLPSVK